jgi:ketosteroid isomerase-like protein
MIDAFNRNDLDAVTSLLDPNIVYTIPGRSPLAGETRGVRAHVAALALARERSGGTLRLDPRAVAADGDYVFVYGRITAERAGRRLDSDHCVVFRFSGGRVVEGRTVPVDLYAFDEFWS